MSAIAGLLHIDGRPVTSDLLDCMVAAAPPRGLDGATCWHSGAAGMIRFANATTPEAVAERQPFHGASGAVALFDGRLDNRDELLGLLGTPDAGLKHAPDGAIALALYERMGREFVRRLVGDYAIAIFECTARRVSLFRSPLGWRPLMWTFDGRTFAFATDARTLVVGLGLERRLNEGALGEYLGGRFLTETETFWSNIQRVAQGAAVFLKDGQIEEWPWHGGPFEDWHGRSMEDHVEEFRRLFDQALIAVNRSNGPVTSQLSGGLDSSSIVCRSAQLFQNGRISRPVGAVTARFPGEPHDETPWSSAVEAHLGITAEVAKSEPFSAQAAHEWVAQSYHLPVRPNALDTMAGVVSLLQSDGRRVLLTGEGGDDWLSGSWAHWPDMLMRGQLGALLQHGRQHWPDQSWLHATLRTIAHAARPILIPRYRQALLKPALDWRIPDSNWLRLEWRQKIELKDRWHRPSSRPSLRGFAQHSKYTVFSHGARQLNAETTIAYAESRGIEVRHPFHDLRIANFSMGAFDNHFRVGMYRKLVLREAMRGTLPEMVRTRTTKAQFVGHTVDSINALLADRPPGKMLPVQMGWVDGDRIEQLHAPFRKWRSEGSQGALPENPWGPVWFAIAADIWLKQAFGL